MTSKERLSFLFIHGAWHNSMHWRETIDVLEQRGHVAAALDLPGHGRHARYPDGYESQDFAVFSEAPSPVGSLTLEQAAAAVITALRDLQHLGQTILVGHSMGGAVITRAAELAPRLIRRLVYVAGYVPTANRSAAYYGSRQEARTPHERDVFIGDPATTGAARINPRASGEAFDRLRELYYHDVPAADVERYVAGLTPDVPVAFWISNVATSTHGWGSVPRTYIRCELDHAVTPALQTIMIADADAHAPTNAFSVLSLQSGHSPFASMPSALADALVQAS